MKSWDARLAGLLVPRLAKIGVHPNTVTTASLLLALAAGWLFAQGEAAAMHWAAGLFVLARFVDHIDGELARRTGTSSRLGGLYDTAAGAISYVALFVGLGIGLDIAGAPWLEPYAMQLGLGAAVAVTGLTAIELVVEWTRGVAPDYPDYAGFELEDGIYLVGPVTWIGWVEPFFALCALGTLVYVMVSLAIAMWRRYGHPV